VKRQREAEGGPATVRQRKKRSRTVVDPTVPPERQYESAADAVQDVINKGKFSKKINYNALNELFTSGQQ
jgi:hypothetical protein